MSAHVGLYSGAVVMLADGIRRADAAGAYQVGGRT